MSVSGFFARPGISQCCQLCGEATCEPVCQWCKNDTCFFYHDRLPVNLLLRPAIARYIRHRRYSALFACGFYQWPLNRLIHQFKFSRQVATARLLARWFAPLCSQISTPPDYLLPVPSPANRYWQRQFNPAGVLADEISRWCHIPVFHGWASRRPGKPQHTQNRSERFTNLRHAFAVQRLPQASCVAIVDDVVTTGCTADALAGLILSQRPDICVQVWAIAVTPAPGRKHDSQAPL